MIPRIFVSSTIRDLQHVRDAIRELVIELGYQPAMSEHGEIGYLPDLSAADACYREAQDCDYGILIIGKRYGDDHRDGVSVTHAEYRVLAEKRVPLITLVEKDLLSYRAIFSANQNPTPTNFPGMDRPQQTFTFLSEVMKSPTNNGIAEFTHIGDARAYVRKQLAHVFGELLRRRHDPLQGEVKDILAEVRSLRNELSKTSDQAAAIRFLRVSRALLDDERDSFFHVLEKMFGDADQPVSAILENPNFDALIANSGWKIETYPNFEIFQTESSQRKTLGFSSSWIDRFSDPTPAGYHDRFGVSVHKGKLLLITENALQLFRQHFHACKAAVEGN